MQIIVDVIILSYAKNESLRIVTENCIRSLLNSENPDKIGFNCLVIESNNKSMAYEFPNTKTIFPKTKFGFNKFMNIGINSTFNEFVCIANNDLLFKENWASSILNEMENDESLLSTCPICTIHHPKIGIQVNTGNYYGYEVKKELVGWCILFKRKILQTIGNFDEKLKFWYCDNDYAMLLEKFQIKHALISNSLVDHLESTTINTLTDRKQKDLTYGEYCYYNYKWNHRSLLKYYKAIIKAKIFQKYDY